MSAVAIAPDHATQALGFDKRIVLTGIIDFIDINRSAWPAGQAVRK